VNALKWEITAFMLLFSNVLCLGNFVPSNHMYSDYAKGLGVLC